MGPSSVVAPCAGSAVTAPAKHNPARAPMGLRPIAFRPASLGPAGLGLVVLSVLFPRLIVAPPDQLWRIRSLLYSVCRVRAQPSRFCDLAARQVIGEHVGDQPGSGRPGILPRQRRLPAAPEPKWGWVSRVMPKRSECHQRRPRTNLTFTQGRQFRPLRDGLTPTGRAELATTGIRAVRWSRRPGGAGRH